MNKPLPVDIRLMQHTAQVLWLVLAALVLAGAAIFVSRHAVFAIRGIAVSGDVSHNNALTLRANVAPHLRGTFFTLDLGRARAAFEAVPWVRQAVVQREFPNRLRVQLQEHRAVAYWGPEGESRLVNSFGEVFEANVGEVEQDGLPRLQGPDGQSAQIWEAFQGLRPLFEPMDLESAIDPHRDAFGRRVDAAGGNERVLLPQRLENCRCRNAERRQRMEPKSSGNPNNR
ncbi:MAG: FtsQ-type POTRA domain-containing protein [Burkholderiales bacterium]|nr:FtsQ-type POTRA domain-containing protein [Burkholderiales bacterium]